MADETKTGMNTGTPGFEIDGKSYTFDVVEKGEEGLDPINTEHGDIHVDHAVKDISDKTKVTLADYLSKYTNGNQYPLDGQAHEGSFTTTKGLPAPLKATENSAHFIDRSNLTTQTTSQEDPRAILVDGVSVGKLDPQKPNGNTLLAGKTPDPVVPRYVSSVLKNNRFTQDSPMIGDPVNDPKNSYNPTLNHPTLGVISVNKLAQVGAALSLRSSQELGSANDGFNPSGTGALAGALLPSANQLGATRIATQLLRAKDVLDDLSNDEVAVKTMLSVSGKSWGQLNNIDDQFSGFKAQGMIGLSVALTAAVLVAFEGLSALVGVISPAPPQTKLAAGRYILGSSTLEKNSNPSSSSGLGNFNFGAGNFVPTLLGVRATTKPFAQCVRRGVEVYFGFEGSTFGASALGSIKQSVASPGHNVIVARSIIRSSVTILESIKGVFNSDSVISGVKNTLNIVEAIRSSKFISAINVFATIGDIALLDNPDETSEGVPGEPIKKSSIDAHVDWAPGFAVSKNRFNEGRTKLAWANNTTPSSYLLPTRFLGLSLASKLGGFQSGYGLQEERTRSKYKLIEVGDQTTNTGRIPYANGLDKLSVQNMEAELEAEYMPFYFHDLRTNEIISFHAFLDDLQETYTPGYENFEGFGRVDPVMIYKNTKRTLSLSFKIVSTSEDDFNDVWVKINKLTTLLYPQYTQGRTISSGDYTFVQPFSQMMGASPMIRLRLGDLIKSNYSRFALARLFGAGTKESLKLGTNEDIDFKISTDEIEKKLEELKRSQMKGWYVSTDGVSVDAISLTLPAFGSVSKEFAQTFKLGADAIYLPVQIQSFADNGESAIVSPSIITAGDLVNFYGFSPSAADLKVQDLNRVYNNPHSVKTRVVGGKYKISYSSLRISPMLAKNVIDSLSTTTASPTVLTALHDFMQKENNALVKAFDSVKGKGLAGFITHMAVNWLDTGVTWETNPGSKAPKICTIHLEYAPIHDIAPGLDHQGYSRAPIYPVGWFSPSRDNDD